MLLEKKKRNGHVVVEMKIRGQVISMYRDVYLERRSITGQLELHSANHSDC